MRTPKVGDSVRARAVAGTHTVLLALDVKKAARDGLLGFAIHRREGNEQYWLKGIKVFPSVVPHPPQNARYTTLEHPIQSLLWGDYTAYPGREYTYTIRPVYGQPKNLEYGDDVKLEVRTERTYGDGVEHGVWFNRGAVASQAYAEKFHNDPPPEPENPEHEQTKWLSRGLLEACLQFINETPAGDALRVAAYEFAYAPILQALKKASARGVDVRVIYEAGKTKVKGELVDTDTTKANKKDIKAAKFSTKTKLIKRTRRKAIPHNKFIVRLAGGTSPVSVWTGSTNFTESGFLGQTNVGHRVNNEEVASVFNDYWEELAKDPDADTLEGILDSLTPNPADQLAGDCTCFFSPRKASKMLKWYGDRVLDAKSAVMYTGGFGVSDELSGAFAEDRDFLRFLLLEKPPTTKTRTALGTDRDLVIVYGSALGEIWKKNSKGELTLRREIPGFELEKWFLHEEHFRKRGHIFFVHTKILLLDPLSDDPLVFTGSANFSRNSLLSNDENMLLIRGDTRVADIYMTEIDRILRHFYFRNVAAGLHGDGGEAAKFLTEDDSWVDNYFRPGFFKDRRRRMFF